jgi:hypothetical protein
MKARAWIPARVSVELRRSGDDRNALEAISGDHRCVAWGGASLISGLRGPPAFALFDHSHARMHWFDRGAARGLAVLWKRPQLRTSPDVANAQNPTKGDRSSLQKRRPAFAEV